MVDDPSRDKDFSFARLSDLKDIAVALKIGALEGKIPPKPISASLDQPELRYTSLQNDDDTKRDLYVSCQLWADGQQYTLPLRTPWKSFSTQWNHTIVLPISYPSLLITAQLAFTIWDIEGSGKAVPVGGTTMRLFTDRRRGKQRLYVHRGVEADSSAESRTPSEPIGKMQDEMGRLEQLVKDHERKDIVGIDWLDRLAFRQVAAVHAAEAAKSPDLYLYVQLPKFDFPIVYTEAESPVPLPPPPQIPKLATAQPQINPALKPNALAEDPWLWRTYDPDVWRDNPVQIKHTKLLRSERLGEAGRDLKPGPADRDRLNEIFRFPPTATLSSNDKDLLWRFRFSLFRSPRSLTKFLKCVTWSDPVEARQAVDKLLPLWGNEVGIDDALELLGPGFTNSKVRAFAVKRLAKADDEELVLYLLQLVQALKFDWIYKSRSRKKAAANSAAVGASTGSHTNDSGLADFLIERAVANSHFGTSLYWYLMIETHGRDDISKMYTEFAWRFMSALEATPAGQRQRATLKRQAELVEQLSTKAKDIRASKDVRSRKIEKLRSYLGDSKHGLAPLPEPLPLPLNARVYVTGVTPEKSSVFKSNLFPLLLWFETTDPAAHLSGLPGVAGEASGTGSADKDREGESGASAASDTAEEEAVTITPDYPFIVKNGDDLRQDQLVIQLFSLMDRLLRKENLDLRLLPYSVLATSKEEGMIQFVPSKSLAAIMAEHGSLQNYLRLEHANEGALGSWGIEPEIMETFVKSCAGYSVLTYILGVGDRHLDNLMLAPDGHFFHVDFGYILGRDPKPYPPPVKVCKEMVDAMGGPTSPQFARFQQLAYTAFIELRKNANLILNLVALMVDAGIQDIQLEPDKAVWKVQEKFMLDVSEEVAIKQFEVLLNDTSYLTVVFDRIHNWAQYLRD